MSNHAMYKVLVAVNYDEKELQEDVEECGDESLREDMLYERCRDMIADVVRDDPAEPVCFFDTIPVVAVEVKQDASFPPYFNQGLVMLPKELFHAVQYALNGLVNTKIGHDKYNDTYAISSALDQIAKDQQKDD